MSESSSNIVSSDQRAKFAARFLIFVLAAALVPITATPAHAATEITVQIDASPLSYDPVSCEETKVRITVFATFTPSQPNPEAAIAFNDAFGAGDYVILPRGDYSQATFITDLVAPRSQFNTIHVRVQGGNLGGFAVTTAQHPWNRPVEPPGQNKRLKCESFIQSLGLGAAALAVAVIGDIPGIGLAADALIWTTATGQLLAAGAVYSGFRSLIDPPDPEFRSIAEAVPFPLPPPPTVGTAEQQAAYAAVAEQMSSYLGNNRAIVTASNRAWGALEAGDSDWRAQQFSAAARFARAAANNAEALPGLLQELQTTLAIDSATGTISASSLNAFQFDVGTNPNSELANKLKAMGFLEDELDFTINWITTLNTMEVEGIPVSTALTAGNAQFAAMASILRDFATYWEGDVATTPTVTNVAPSSGPESGGTRVTLSGTMLNQVADIRFGDVLAVDTSCTALTCETTAPGGAGDAPITLITAGGSVVTPASAPRFRYEPLAGSTVRNGSFEAGLGIPAVDNYETFAVGALGPWTIASGGIDLVSPAQATAASGQQFIDLNGNGTGPGSISQNVPTNVGTVYQLSFSLAGNPNDEPQLKSLSATFGEVVCGFTFDTRDHTNEDLGWQRYTVTTTATSVETPILFVSQTEGTAGPIIDDVAVIPIAAPAGCAAPAVPAPVPPVATGIQPSSGPAIGGTEVTIIGTNLGTVTTASFGVAVASDLACSNSACTVTSPAGTGTVDVVLTTAGGSTSAVGAIRFEYLAAPAVPHPPQTSIEKLPATGLAIPNGFLLAGGLILSAGLALLSLKLVPGNGAKPRRGREH